MSVKSEKINEGSEKPKSYPKIMEIKSISRKYHCIVLFSEEGSGIVIGGNGYSIGHYSNEWPTKHFSDYNESIVLKNE